MHRVLPFAMVAAFPGLAAALDAWRAGGPLAPPRHIDPLSLPPRLLPYALLAEREQGGRRLRVRLAGTMLCEMAGGELKGKAIDEILPAAHASALLATAGDAAALRQPLLVLRRDLPWPGHRLDYVALLLPLAGIGQAVDWLLELIDPDTMRYRPV